MSCIKNNAIKEYLENRLPVLEVNYQTERI